MKRVIALVDLDDTLFQTRRKCPEGLTDSELVTMSVDAAGNPSGYATPKQAQFANWLLETSLFIPVTARSLAALRRVKLRYGAAICAHGGMILNDDGQVDGDWDAHIRSSAAKTQAETEALVGQLTEAARLLGVAVEARVQFEGDIPLYALARHRDADEGALAAVADRVSPPLPPGWTDHRNSNAVAFLPPFLGKQHAVAHILPSLRARFADQMILGIGDSLSDAPFMHLCDFAMTPTGSQLAKASADHLFK